MKLDNLTKYKKIVAPIILLVVGVFILRIVLNYSDQIKTSLPLISWQSILFSSIFYLGYFYLRALSWHYILNSLNRRLNFKDSLSSYFLGESTRYIPGNIWSFVSRTYLAGQKGIPKSILLISLAAEVFLVIFITAILSIPALAASSNLVTINPTKLILLLIVFLVILTSYFFFKNKIEFFIKELKEFKMTPSSIKALIPAIIFQLLAWFSFGLGTYNLILNFGVGNPTFFISIPIFAWLIGYLSFISPMGLGIREGALILLLNTKFDLGQATVIAILSRLVLVLIEVLNVGFWLYTREKRRFYILLKNLLNRWDLIALTIFILAYIIIFSTLSILRHEAFASNFDLANMSQTVWNTLHGRPFVLSGAESTISRFSIHADLILILLSPIFLFWEHARTLLVIQSVALGLGAIPVYFLVKRIFSNFKSIHTTLLKFISLAMVLVYLLNPGMEWTNIYDFHGVALAIPLLLSAFYFAYTKNWRWFWVFSFLAMTTKEEISLYVAILGLVIATVFKEHKVGLIAFVVGVIWSIAMIFLVIPYFSQGGSHWAFEWYQFQDPTTEKVSSIPTVSTVIYKFLFVNDVIDYYVGLLKPFAYLPLLGLPWLILSIPELAINVLSSHGQMRSTVFHYDSGITPSLIIATIFGISYLYLLVSKIRWIKKYSNHILGLVIFSLVVIAFRTNYHYSPLPTTPSCWCLSYQVTQEDKDFAKVLKTIPEDTSITSSGEIRPHLTKRENNFVLPNATDSAQYVAILDQNRIVGDYSPKEFENVLLNEPVFLNTHELINHIGHFYLFKKK